MQAANTIDGDLPTDMVKNNSIKAWVVTLTASLFFFYIFIQLNLFNAIDVELMQYFQIDAMQLGKLSSMFFYANVLFLFPAGIMLDRFSTKKLLLAACLLATVGTLIFAKADTFMIAAVGRFLVGIGGAFSFLSCVKIATRWFPPSKMALVTGLCVTMAMLGGLVAQTPLTVLSSTIGWQKALLFDGYLGVAIFLVIFTLVKDAPSGAESQLDADKAHLDSLGFWRSIGLVMLNPQNWFGGIYTALMNLPVFLLGALFGIHYLVEVQGISTMQASYATTLFFVGVIFGSPFFGWFSDHLGKRIMPMVLGAISSLVVMGILLFAPNLSYSAILLLFFLVGFVTSSQVLSYPTIAELNPSSLTSTAVSVISVVIMFSGVVFQPFFGWVMQFNWDGAMKNGAPLYSSQDFQNAMLIMPVSFIVALVIAFLMKETNCEMKEYK